MATDAIRNLVNKLKEVRGKGKSLQEILKGFSEDEIQLIKQCGSDYKQHIDAKDFDAVYLADINFEVYQKDNGKIVECLRLLVETDKNAIHFYNLGAAFSDLKEYEKALDAYDRAITLDPNDAFSHNRKGNVYHDLKEYEKALAAYDLAIALDPKDAYAHNVKGNVYSDLKEYEKALAAYDLAIALDPKDAYAHNVKGNVYSDLKEYEKALAAYDLAIALDPKAAYPHNGKGNVYRDLKEFYKALAAYDSAIALDPKFAYPHIGKGYVYYDLKDYEKALASHDTALALDPNLANSHNGKGNVYLNLLEYEKALAAYDKAIALDPKLIYPYNNKGIVYINLKEYEKALAVYNTVIALDPNDPHAYNGIGNVYNDLTEYEKALATYDSAIALDPNYASPQNGKGVVFENLKEYEKALVAYNKAVELNPNDPIFHRNKGDALNALNKKSEALTSYDKAVELDPNNSTYRKIRDELAAQLGKSSEIKVLNSNISYDQITEAVQELNDEDKNELSQFYFSKVNPLIDQIRDLSLTTESVWQEAYGDNYSPDGPRLVAHYSSLRTADIFIMQGDVKMRYSNAVFMNDPEEGRILIECLNHLETGDGKTSSGEIKKAFYSILNEAPNYYYIGSFMPVAKGHEDELLMWRTYGKDENLNEAAGCCMVLDASFFDKYEPQDKKTTSLDGDRNNKGEDIKQPLKKVFYYNQRSNEFIGKDKDALQIVMEKLQAAMNELLSLRRNSHVPYDLKYNKAIEKLLYASLSEERYSFKSADYSYESELRVIQYSSQLETSVIIDEATSSIPRKMYVNSNQPIRRYLRKIVLGPKVPHPSRWMYMEEKLKHELTDKSIEVKVVYSECKFQ